MPLKTSPAAPFIFRLLRKIRDEGGKSVDYWFNYATIHDVVAAALSYKHEKKFEKTFSANFFFLRRFFRPIESAEKKSANENKEKQKKADWQALGQRFGLVLLYRLSSAIDDAFFPLFSKMLSLSSLTFTLSPACNLFSSCPNPFFFWLVDSVRFYDPVVNFPSPHYCAILLIRDTKEVKWQHGSIKLTQNISSSSFFGIKIN